MKLEGFASRCCLVPSQEVATSKHRHSFPSGLLFVLLEDLGQSYSRAFHPG